MACKEVLMLCIVVAAFIQSLQAQDVRQDLKKLSIQQTLIEQELKSLSKQMGKNHEEQISVSKEILRQQSTNDDDSPAADLAPAYCHNYLSVTKRVWPPIKILKTGQGSVYYFDSTPVSWKTAETTCKVNLNSNLVMIESKAQLMDLDEAFKGVKQVYHFWVASAKVQESDINRHEAHSSKWASIGQLQAYQCVYANGPNYELSRPADCTRETNSIVCVLTERAAACFA